MDIIYEDADILVCYKPAGLPVQTKRIREQDLYSQVKVYLAEKGKKEPYVGIIHRLDQPVEGVLVIAKTPDAAKKLSAQVAERKMIKYYLAATVEKPEKKQGVLEDYLVKNAGLNQSKVAEKGQQGAKKAVLEYELLAEKEGHYIWKIHLITGRHHQIRVQTAYAGFPLIGDKKYNSAAVSEMRNMPLALCACSLGFVHPKTKKKLVFKIKPKGYYFDSITF